MLYQSINYSCVIGNGSEYFKHKAGIEIIDAGILKTIINMVRYTYQYHVLYGSCFFSVTWNRGNRTAVAFFRFKSITK